MIGTRNRRERRQRGTGYTGVLRDSRVTPSVEPIAVNHSAPRDKGFSWRWVSAAIIVVLSLVLVFFYTSSVFYVRSIAVGGLKYLTKEEVFAFADIANMHIFWVNPQQVRANLLRSPSIADARVRITWPPQMVHIILEEREPAIVWEQGGAAVWVDVQGRIMAQRVDRPDLLVVQASEFVPEGPMSDRGRVSPELVLGALQLQTLIPTVTRLRYEPAKGLGFVDPGGWQVWLGTGQHIAEKVAIYRAIAADLMARGIQPGEVNVADPDYPYYTKQWGS
ncbi:MAG: FtsQ-type POTRA domain-containing protein [Anaerolineae bacterium]